MTSRAPTVIAYLNQLPEERKAVVQAVREAILNNMHEDMEEGMQYGMIGYYIPHRVYPKGYHCDVKQAVPFAGLAAQKAYYSLYLIALYSDPELLKWFEAEWHKTGKKLEMGKSCIHFRAIDDLPLELIGQVFKKFTAQKYIDLYESHTVGLKGQLATRKVTRKEKKELLAKKAAESLTKEKKTTKLKKAKA